MDASHYAVLPQMCSFFHFTILTVISCSNQRNAVNKLTLIFFSELSAPVENSLIVTTMDLGSSLSAILYICLKCFQLYSLKCDVLQIPCCAQHYVGRKNTQFYKIGITRDMSDYQFRYSFIIITHVIIINEPFPFHSFTQTGL